MRHFPTEKGFCLKKNFKTNGSFSKGIPKKYIFMNTAVCLSSARHNGFYLVNFGNSNI